MNDNTPEPVLAAQALVLVLSVLVAASLTLAAALASLGAYHL